jgi:hypothetical protein
MSYYSCYKIDNENNSVFENFQSVPNISTDGLLTWMETSQFNGKEGQKIQSWGSSAPDKSNNFVNKSGNESQYPIVKDKILNGLAVLEFSNQNMMEMKDNSNLKFENYTMVFVSRQIKKSNQRFVIGGDNKLYGYWGNGKDRMHLDGWVRYEGTPTSDDSWDMYVIRRQKDNNTGQMQNYMNNAGTVLPCANGGNGLNGLYLNMGGCCGGERSDAQIAEFMLYNKFLSDAEVVKIESYLAKKWGLEKEMDEKHPSYVPKPPSAPNAEPPVLEIESFEGKVTKKVLTEFPVQDIKLWVDVSQVPKPRNGAKIQKLESRTLDKEYWLEAKEDGGNLKIGANGLNGLPVLEFTVDKEMGINKSLKAKEYTLIFVTRQLEKQNKRFIIGRGNKLYGYHDNGKEKLHIDGWVTNEQSPSNNKWDIYTITRSAKGLNSFNRNGNNISVNVPGGQPLDGIFINQGDGHCCNNETSDGQFAEMLIWDKFLGEKQIEVVQNYLIRKWGLQTVMSSSHPLFKPTPKGQNANAVPPAGFANFPVDEIQVWADASTLSDSANKQINNWPGATKDKKYFFRNQDNKGPTVVDKVLNNLPVLEFTPEQSLQLNKNLVSEEYTLIFLSRQIGKKNGRFIVGEQNRLFGYHDKLKNRLHVEGWIENVNIAMKPSDDKWDLYVIKRNKKGLCSFYRNGRRFFEKKKGTQFFRNLYINNGPGNCCPGEASNAQLAEILFWTNELELREVNVVESYLIKKWGITDVDEFHSSKSMPKVSGQPNAKVVIVKAPTKEEKFWGDKKKVALVKAMGADENYDSLHEKTDTEDNDDKDEGQKAGESREEFIKRRDQRRKDIVAKIKKDQALEKFENSVVSEYRFAGSESKEKLAIFNSTINAIEEQLINYSKPDANFPNVGLTVWNDAAIFEGQNQGGVQIENWESSTNDKAITFVNSSDSGPMVLEEGLNGLPVLEFGKSDSMELNTPIAYEEFTIAYLARQTKNTNGRFVVGDGNSLFGYHGGQKDRIFSEGWVDINSNTASNNQWDLYVIRRDSNKNYSLFRNGNRTYTDVPAPNVKGLPGLYLNKNKNKTAYEPSDAQLAEIFVWNRSLVGKEIEQVEKYLANKWNIRHLLVPTHPFFKDSVLETKIKSITIGDQVKGLNWHLRLSQIVVKDHSGRNVAPRGKISGSPAQNPSNLNNLIDGKEINRPQHLGYFSSSTDNKTSITLELKEPIFVKNIQIYNSNDAPEQLRAYHLILKDEDNRVVQTELLKGDHFQEYKYDIFDVDRAERIKFKIELAEAKRDKYLRKTTKTTKGAARPSAESKAVQVIASSKVQAESLASKISIPGRPGSKAPGSKAPGSKAPGSKAPGSKASSKSSSKTSSKSKSKSKSSSKKAGSKKTSKSSSKKSSKTSSKSKAKKSRR